MPPFSIEGHKIMSSVCVHAEQHILVLAMNSPLYTGRLDCTNASMSERVQGHCQSFDYWQSKC